MKTSPLVSRASELPVWSAAPYTGTLFREGQPTGTELITYKRGDRSAKVLITQANTARELAAFTELAASYLEGAAEASGPNSVAHGLWQQAQSCLRLIEIALQPE